MIEFNKGRRDCRWRRLKMGRKMRNWWDKQKRKFINRLLEDVWSVHYNKDNGMVILYKKDYCAHFTAKEVTSRTTGGKQTVEYSFRDKIGEDMKEYRITAVIDEYTEEECKEIDGRILNSTDVYDVLLNHFNGVSEYTSTCRCYIEEVKHDDGRKKTRNQETSEEAEASI